MSHDEAMSKEVDQYRGLMLEVRNRISATERILNNPSALGFRATAIESIYLQIRLILEAIALGSLIANKSAYSNVHSSFSKEWNARKLVKRLEEVNPNFYPVPINQVQTGDPKFPVRWEKVTSGFLTVGEFIELYGKCGNILHRPNPYGHAIDYKEYENSIPAWINKIIALLKAHQVHFVNTTDIWLIQITPDGLPSCHIFSKVT